MTKKEQWVEGRWRIVETEIWDREALDLVVPAHITFGRNGLGDMALIAIRASIDCRVETSGGAVVLELSGQQATAAVGRGTGRGCPNAADGPAQPQLSDTALGRMRQK